MTDPLATKTETTVVPPVTVTVIGTDAAGAPLTTGTQATTPDHQPNLIVQVVNPLVAVALRFLNVYLGNLVGLVTAGMTSNAIPAQDFGHLVAKCAGLAVAGAVVLSMKDILTVFSGLEKRWPLASGSV